MKKVIRRWGARPVFTDDGIALRRGISGRQCKFLRRDEVAAAGYFVGSGTHVAYDADAASLYPHMQLVAREYNAPELFVYFSVAQPKGFGGDAVLPLLRDGRNIFFNLGGGDFCALENIKKIADITSAVIGKFYGGKILNRSATFHG